jgi:hypothetical protein
LSIDPSREAADARKEVARALSSINRLDSPGAVLTRKELAPNYRESLHQELSRHREALEFWEPLELAQQRARASDSPRRHVNRERSRRRKWSAAGEVALGARGHATGRRKPSLSELDGDEPFEPSVVVLATNDPLGRAGE